MTPMFEHVAIVVDETKWESTLSFYEKVFGLHEAAGDREGTHVFLAGENSTFPLELLRRTENAPLRAPGHVAFVTFGDEWTAFLDHLAANGVAVGEIKERADGGASTLVQDPAGNTVQVLRRPEPLKLARD